MTHTCLHTCLLARTPPCPRPLSPKLPPNCASCTRRRGCGRGLRGAGSRRSSTAGCSRRRGEAKWRWRSGHASWRWRRRHARVCCRRRRRLRRLRREGLPSHSHPSPSRPQPMLRRQGGEGRGRGRAPWEAIVSDGGLEELLAARGRVQEFAPAALRLPVYGVHVGGHRRAHAGVAEQATAIRHVCSACPRPSFRAAAVSLRAVLRLPPLQKLLASLFWFRV